MNLKPPKLSIIVIFHNMTREARRTLYTLSTAYQEGIKDSDYEVIAIDNGSAQPLCPEDVRKFGPNFKYRFIDTESVSPVSAVNQGVSSASSEFIAVIVDGARMITPGLIRESLLALQTFPNPFICALAWHLGPDVQNQSILNGYDKHEENHLLESIRWKTNGYQLFQISTLAPSSGAGFLGGMPSECSWFAMPRLGFTQLGGFDERFQSKGGGLVNHDFLKRVLEKANSCPVVILGEGTFHQIHGGVATNSHPDQHPREIFSNEHQIIRGKAFKPQASIAPYYMGKISDSARKFVHRQKP